MSIRSAAPCLAVLALSACGSAPVAPGPECTSHADCGADLPFCAAETETCTEPPPGSELGWGDGSAESVELTVILADASLRQPVDLGFNPSKPTELWVVNYKDDSAVIVTDPGEPTMTFERRKDPDAEHFMHRPPALAFGAVSDAYGQTFAVCGDSDNGGDDFMGPALFSASLDIFAVATPSGLGSHLDMLHSTSFCRGIEHASDNVYFAFNSDKGSIDKYDFHADHGPGNEDHSDGEIFRYASGELAGVDGIPSHLSLDAASGKLFVADTGHGRVVALDTTTGTVGPAFFGDEPAKRRRIDGAVLTELVAPGALQAPSGIELARGLLLISDDATSRFVAVDLEGKVVRSLETGLPAGSLAGLTVGPDGRLYFVDMIGGRVLRIDPLP